ncbi:MAG: gamma-glutamylcyclotransferase [Rhodobacteraceae bacterium]|nr:gamma-glutamylcyclotransferase [Paracoccaceae bacterium]
MYENGLWVFGYGSLIWKPGFEYAERQLAALRGFHRGFCMWSVHYRGTTDAPGLVLALEKKVGASCGGVAYYVSPSLARSAHDYLRGRELVSAAYMEEQHSVRLTDGREVLALCYVVDRDHSQYAGGLGLSEQAEVIARASGSAGHNCAYLHNTARHLAELGIRDGDIEQLSRMVPEARS